MPLTASPASQLMRLMDGFVTTQLIHVAARLGIADALADGPRPGEELARAVGVEAGPLCRVLRNLVIEGVLDETDDGRFALTAVGACLVPLRGAALARGDLYYRSAAGLADTVMMGGTPPFERVYGEPFFEHLGHHPGHEADFQASMVGRAEQEAGAVVAAYDFGGLGLLVDVGGGSGILLSAILGSSPGLHGVLVDRAGALPTAGATLGAAGLTDRVSCLEGDFFVDVPAGADAYVLSRVLHDWHDDDAVRILRTCRRAMAPDSRLLVIDAILPERAVDGPAAVRIDLHMLLLFGSRERTAAELRALLEAADLRFRRLAMRDSPAGLGVIEAVPA
jgi:SAM-dependent methyltransferase